MGFIKFIVRGYRSVFFEKKMMLQDGRHSRFSLQSFCCRASKKDFRYNRCRNTTAYKDYPFHFIFSLAIK